LDGEVDSQGIKGTVKATIYATQGNKSRMEIDFDIDGKADKLLFLTDGKARYTKQGDKGTLDPNPKKAEQEGKLVPGTIARIGITGAMLMARSVKPGEEKEVDLDKDAPVTNFELGAKEMVGDKTAQVVTYKLDFDGTSAKMSVWIDTKTQLPLKRVVAVDQDGQMHRITETYSTFAIDPKLDPKLFEIPKE
jgi:outer membrane lipoprotein-sorting protein